MTHLLNKIYLSSKSINHFKLHNKIFLSSLKPFFNISASPRISTLNNISRENFVPFETMVESRCSEAARSIVVEIPKEENLDNLHSLCTNYGTIRNILEFLPISNKRMVIIEFEEERSLQEIIYKAQLFSNGDVGSIQIPFLKMNKQKRSHLKDLKSKTSSISIIKENGLLNEEIFKYMRDKCNNISEQIQYFYETQKMTEVGWRLRFITCRKIEWVLPKIFSHIRVLPFGSSVNTFGNNSCDLDMIIDFSKLVQSQKDESFPFVIQPGKETNNSRGCIQKNLEVVADLMSFYMPGFSHIIRILHANVPIIKCNEMFTGLECDITVNNKSGFYMSELLYLYGCTDPRVRPLVFCMRLWAKQRRLTRKNQPGRWFSNFTTTLLVLFFLMNTSSPVIPSLLILEQLSDNSFSCEGITYSFVRDIAQLSHSCNDQSLEELFGEFFEFYANFNFKKNGISIVTGKSIPKPNYSALYIQNPIERELNVSKQINLEELEAFKMECAIASYNFSNARVKSKSSDLWGLLAIIADANANSSEKSKRFLDFDIKSLLETGTHTSEDMHSTKGQGAVSNPSPKISKLKVDKDEKLIESLGLNLSKSERERPAVKTKRNRNINRRYPPTFKF